MEELRGMSHGKISDDYDEFIANDGYEDDDEDKHVYGIRLGSLRFHENKIYVAPNEYAPITDSIEIRDMADLKKIITKKLLKDKPDERK